jgi:hypothetical protein
MDHEAAQGSTRRIDEYRRVNRADRWILMDLERIEIDSYCFFAITTPSNIDLAAALDSTQVTDMPWTGSC